MTRYAGPALCFTMLLAGCAATLPPTVDARRAELLESCWRPVEIDGKLVVIHAGTREQHIILKREGGRVTGYSGCNTLAGGIRVDGDSLHFGPLAMSRMASASRNAFSL